KTSACAHLSPVGNIAACVADLWSNESVKNIKLLSGMAPTAYMEQLIYDCRLMNVASGHGRKSALMLRDWLAESDYKLDPQAYVLKPDVVLDISRVIVSEDSSYLRAKKAALYTLDILEKAVADGEVKVEEREMIWFDTLRGQLIAASDDEEQFIADTIKTIDSTKLDPKKYDLV
ncbi:MAG: methanol--corrinoid methyltransferase, partial [Clostridiales bacterium]|nr:methanol--corrinoid methyltransferase [Clostridiales bacterium]